MFINFSTRNLDACIHIHNIIYVYMLSRARNLKSPWANHATLFSHLKASGLEARDGFISFFICFFLFFALYTWTIFHFCFFFLFSCFDTLCTSCVPVYKRAHTREEGPRLVWPPAMSKSNEPHLRFSIYNTLYTYARYVHSTKKKKKNKINNYIIYTILLWDSMCYRDWTLQDRWSDLDERFVIILFIFFSSISHLISERKKLYTDSCELSSVCWDYRWMKWNK